MADVLLLAVLLSSLVGCTSLPVFRNVVDSADVNAASVATRPATVRVAQLPAQIPAPQFDTIAPSPRSAGAGSLGSSISAPQPFRWEQLASSAGRRSIDGVTIGDSGYRTLVIGSLAGDDPVAVTLAENLARHLHENSLIVGGIQTTILRNLNPDGEASHRMENSAGVYLNREFLPQDAQTAAQPEVQFLLDYLQTRQPRRVIHLRTHSQGLIASGPASADIARETAEWLGFELMILPGAAAEGTLERRLSAGPTEIVTLAIPSSVSRDQTWDLYGGALINLLQSEDYRSREVARKKPNATSADSRSTKSRRYNRPRNP